MFKKKVEVHKPAGTFLTYVSHDWCDPTTWYGNATQVTGGSLSGSGTGPYTSGNSNWIDATNGKIFDETNLSYPVKIYDNAVLQNSGYTVSYTDGSVTFDSAPTGPVTADYHYENGSVYTLGPASNKILRVEHAEIQFAKNVTMNEIHWEVWAYNPYDLPNKVMVEKRVYKNAKDVINVANLGQGYIPAFSGLTNDILVFPFKYTRMIDLRSSLGLEMRISIAGDTAFTGEWSTVTFYTAEENE